MKQLLVATLALGALVSVFGTSRADSAPALLVTHTPELVVEEVSVPLTAKAYSVVDIETGTILLSHNADEVLPIASVTKLFTAAALSATAYDTAVTITKADVGTEGRAGKLEIGQVYSAHELLFPLLLESSNDAAIAIERVTGPVTVAGNTLADTAGLSSKNKLSAATLAREVQQLYHAQPHIFDITTLPQAVGSYTGWVNNSPVADLPGYRGGKHGYTEAAGKTLAAVFSEPALRGRELGYVILGSEDIKADAAALRLAVEHSVHLE
jgi:D-alanyl-D-alanine carboxypeptidase